MAMNQKNKQKTKSLMDGIKERVETEQKENEMEIRKQKLEERLQNTLTKYIEFEQDYGEEDYRTVMMKSILETAVVMKDTIKTLEGMKEAFQYMFEAMDIVDMVFNLFQDSLQNSLGNNYGFFARLKQRRRLKKALRNNVNRMKQIGTMVSGMGDLSVSITKTLQQSSMKMKKKMAKQNQKNSKGGTNQPVDATTARVNQMIAEARGQKGVEIKPTTPPSVDKPNGDTPTSGPKGTTKDTGIDDL